MEDLNWMATEYNGLSGIFNYVWTRFSDKDCDRFLKVSNYLNDVLNYNVYGYPMEKVTEVYRKGTRILKKLLKKYGIAESSFSPGFLEIMAESSYEYGLKLFENMSPEMKEKLEDLAKRKTVLGRLVKDKKVIRENRI